MKQKRIALSQHYVTALRTHLKQGPRASLLPAAELGRRAVELRLGTLELARIHEQAIATLELTNVKNALTKLAGIFFAEANQSIEETQRPGRQARIYLSRMEETPGERTEELATTNRQLSRDVIRHKAIQDAAHKNGRHYKKCLEESLELQKRLRQLTHQVLAAQEDDRRRISLALHDEIAQTLLGIKVRLLSLKQEARRNHKGLQNEIASTQQLVEKSVDIVHQFAPELRPTVLAQIPPGKVTRGTSPVRPEENKFESL